MQVHDVTPPLIDKDPRWIKQLWEGMWWRVHYAGRGGIAAFAVSAIDIAVWDLCARCAGEPLWRFLGSHSDQVRVYAGGTDL